MFSTPALTWDDLAKAREWTTLPILLKGIVHPDDAARAVDVGADGVWVSNHGGRQIDQSVPTLEALPAVVERVGGRAPVIFDSGVRQGSDAFIALALWHLMRIGPARDALTIPGLRADIRAIRGNWGRLRRRIVG